MCENRVKRERYCSKKKAKTNRKNVNDDILLSSSMRRLQQAVSFLLIFHSHYMKKYKYKKKMWKEKFIYSLFKTATVI